MYHTVTSTEDWKPSVYVELIGALCIALVSSCIPLYMLIKECMQGPHFTISE